MNLCVENDIKMIIVFDFVQFQLDVLWSDVFNINKTLCHLVHIVQRCKAGKLEQKFGYFFFSIFEMSRFLN